jgi:phosphatidylglycerophosphate synthase
MVTSTTSPGKPGRIGRPLELEDGLNRYIYHPLAGRLALALKPTGISPNAVSIMGALLIWAAAWAYTGLDWPQSALIGFGFHVLWHVFDGADGDLARISGKASPLGELVDGVCDYAGHAVLYVALAAFLAERIGGSAWALTALAVMSHVVQANHGESQRRTYLWWAYGVPWLKHARARDDELFRRRHWFTFAFGWMATAYLKLAASTNRNAEAVDRAAAEAAGDPQREARMRAVVKEGAKTSLLLQKLLSSNPRTVILGISMALGTPLYFFLTEIVLLNVVLVYSVHHHKLRNLELSERLMSIET